MNTVLIADDNPFVLKSVSRLLEACREIKTVFSARNGQEAVEIAKRYAPTIVILDLSMPLLDGIQAAGQIKQLKPETPIILFTVHSYARNVKSATLNSWGISAVVSKDDGGMALMNKVREFLQEVAA